MKEAELVQLMIQRKSIAKRKDEPWIKFIKEYMRKRIETRLARSKFYF